MFKKVLIANRGEIAVRIAQTLREMGIGVVAVYSEPDRAAPHVAAADEAWPLEGQVPADTYLRADKIIAIARERGADAIHPGYGFLAENAEFASACRDARIAFIGPPPEVIRAAGDKINARRVATDAGVPVVPGWTGSRDAGRDAVRTEAERIGYPLLVKAAAGGGGRGMRRANSAAELNAALDAAAREARAAFGDDRLFLERCIERPRHVEIQVFGDGHGGLVHLFERDCSVQRRYQKVIEETPSPASSPDLRAAMADAALRVSRALRYVNAGTVEFLVDEGGRFYFLEINTRLQVEHPVTEMTLGCDLVRAQVLVAAGQPLPFAQEDLLPRGHAIEFRICAEDPAADFRPCTGVVRRFRPPLGPGIRVDAGIVEGTAVTPHYDALLAKVIVRGPDRPTALARARRALDEFVLLGVTHNVGFLRRVLDHPDFAAGRVHTHFLADNPITTSNGYLPDEALVIAAWAALRRNSSGHRNECIGDRAPNETDGPWDAAGAWRTL